MRQVFSMPMRTGSQARPGRWALVVALASLAFTPGATPSAPQSDAGDSSEVPPVSAYAGDSACAKCHQKEFKPYVLTGHARDSAPATAEKIKGKFTPGENVVYTSRPGVAVTMNAA